MRLLLHSNLFSAFFPYSIYLFIGIVHNLMGFRIEFLCIFLNNRIYFMINPGGYNQYCKNSQYFLYRFEAEQITQEGKQDISNVYIYDIESPAKIFQSMTLQFV